MHAGNAVVNRRGRLLWIVGTARQVTGEDAGHSPKVLIAVAAAECWTQKLCI